MIANGIDRLLRWDGHSAQAEAAGVEPPPSTTTPAVAGSGSGGLSGTYSVYVRFVDKNGNTSNLSPVSAEVTVAAVETLTFSNLPTPTQGTVARRQVLRNTDGQTSTYYVDVDSTDLYSTTLTSTRTDASLAAQTAVVLLDARGRDIANRFAVPPSDKPFLAFHLGRMWLAGEQAYAEGSCQVAFNSTTVTGVATEWKATFVGRFLYVQGATRAYEIDAVDESAQTITLTETYRDSTDLFAQYAVKPSAAEASLLYFSEAGLPEAWPATNAFALPEDGDVVTGLFTFGSFLWITKRRRTYRMTAQSNPVDDGFVFEGLGRGCVNQRCRVVVEENVYLLDEAGVYRTGGGDSAEQLSTPIQGFFRRNEAGAINWSAAHFFHCVFHPGEETIRWFVALRGDYLPRHALCLHYKTGKWWTEEYPVPVGSSCLGRVGRLTGVWSDGGEQVYLGSSAGRVLALGGDLDGLPSQGPTTRGSVTAAGSDSLTDASAAFDTSGINVPVVVTAGRGAGQVRVVVAATATRLTVDEPWQVKPDATSRYQLGGVRYRWTSGRLRYAPSEDAAGRSVELQYQPTALPLLVRLRLFQDFGLAAREVGREVGPGQERGVRAARGEDHYDLDLSKPLGHYWKRFDGHRERGTDGPRLARLQIEGTGGPEPVRFGEMLLNGMVR